MNNKSLEEIWQLACEIEGLTLLADKKENETLKDLLSLIKSKSESLSIATSEYINSLSATNETSEDDTELPSDYLPESVIDLDNEDDSDRAHGNLEDDFDAIDDVSESDDEDRVTGNFDDDYDILDVETIASNDNINEDSESSYNNDGIEPETTEIESDDFDDYIVCEEDDEIEVIDDEVEIVDNDIAEFEDNSTDIDADEVGEFISDNDGSQNTGWTVEHKIAVNESKDLKHAFTINDRYRFKRELFANSEIELNDTLNLLSAMATIGEAEEYFFEDLEWDKDNEDVIDFMTILKKHFASKQ